MKNHERTLVIVDGNYLAYRSYWGVRGLTTSKGLIVNAVFGFLNSLRKIVEDLRPDKLAIVFDGKGKTWRHQLVEDNIASGVAERKYKDRTKVGLENFYQQMGIIKKFMKALRIRYWTRPATESDDIIATLTKKYDPLGYKIILFTKDKDFYQLLKYNLAMYKPDGVIRKYYDDSDFRKDYIITPSQWCFACSLSGDGSDTIPGIRGIGEKKACLVAKEFGKLKNLINFLKENDHLHKYGCSISKDDINKIRMNYKLKKLVDVPDLKPVPKMRKVNRLLLKKLLKRYEMESLTVTQFRLVLEGNIT